MAVFFLLLHNIINLRGDVMKKKLKFFIIVFVVLTLISSFGTVFALDIKEPSFDLNVKSAVLIEAKTGTILYGKNENTPLPPASVTKVMTLLLIFEAIEKGNLKYDEELTVSEYAASMGGSQVYLEPGEKMTVDDLLKCVIIASANDAALTLAEQVAGSEESFVDMMNKRASELGMKSTYFENVTGLDDDVTNHLTSAYDIALMSRELIKHEKVSEYATIWMDTIRNGEFGLTNTNRLVRFYKGITGLKTGSTSKAGFCVSVTAKRNGMELIAVIMGAESSEIRNSAATKLLDYGFANYMVKLEKGNTIENLPILCGTKNSFNAKFDDYVLLENKDNRDLTYEIEIDEEISAPIKEGDKVGRVIYKIGDKVLCEKPVLSCENVDRITYFQYFVKILKEFIIL